MSFSRLVLTTTGLSLRAWVSLASACLVCGLIFTFLNGQVFFIRLDGADQRVERAGVTQDVLSTQPANLPTEGDLGEDAIVIYNRIPKTGSTSFGNVISQLGKINNFHFIHFNVSRNLKILGLADQRRFITNITNWNERKPALYNGHLAYVDFSRFGVQQQPIYINMVRHPLDRITSHYYFLRFGDDFDPDKVRKKANDAMTFDECIATNGVECGPRKMWVQIPLFCGHSPYCWEPGNLWALEEAKHNLLHNYLVVGITERLQDFMAVLEVTLPRFFHGATEAYKQSTQTHLRQTTRKIPPSEETLAILERLPAYRMEREFYMYANKIFSYMTKHTLGPPRARAANILKKKIFAFDKISPKKMLTVL